MNSSSPAHPGGQPTGPKAPVCPADAPALAPTHAALVAAMLGAVVHLGDLAREVSSLELTLHTEAPENLRSSAQEVTAEIRAHLDMMTLEIMVCCGELTGDTAERSIVGHAVDLARLQASEGRSAMERGLAVRARSHFGRSAQGAA